jgi:electron transfer flavoprotein beta subunit
VKIVVCIKHIVGLQLPGFAGSDDSVRDSPNPLDLNAVEEALRLRADSGGGEVVVVTVGPPQAELSLKRAIMMGADRAVRTWDGPMGEADSFLISEVLCKTVKAIGFDLVLCGARSADIGSGVVGALLAEQLDLPLIAGAFGLRYDAGAGQISADKRLERGMRETYAAHIPAVVTIERGPNEPRWYGAGWVHRLLRRSVEARDLRSLGMSLSTQSRRIGVVAITPPRPRTKLGINVASLSLEEKLRLMLGQTRTGAAQARVADRPQDAARKIKEHLDKWLG